MSEKPQSPKNKNPVGPFSKDRSLANLDKRTRAGRVLRTVISDLTEHLGGAPTAPEQLIIQSAALKSCRLFLLSEKLLDGGEIGDDSDHHCLAWLNSLRLDLAALGLARRVKDITPTLADLIKSQGASAEGAAS